MVRAVLALGALAGVALGLMLPAPTHRGAADQHFIAVGSRNP